MPSVDTKAIVREWVEQAWNKRNDAYIDPVLSSSYVLHAEGAPPFLGPAGFRQLRDLYVGAFPDMQIAVEDLVAEGDRCVWRFTARGTHTGDFMGIPPSGKQFQIGGVIISRFEGERWAEDWGLWDMFTMLQQIGAIPAATTA